MSNKPKRMLQDNDEDKKIENFIITVLTRNKSFDERIDMIEDEIHKLNIKTYDLQNDLKYKQYLIYAFSISFAITMLYNARNKL